MPKGTPQHLLDHPETAKCWCGEEFVKKADNQVNCSPWHRKLASYLRGFMPIIPPPSPQVKKARPPQAPDPLTPPAPPTSPPPDEVSS